MFNYKLAEIAHEIDKVNLNELTPIEALNTLVKLKESWREIEKNIYNINTYRNSIIKNN